MKNHQVSENINQIVPFILNMYKHHNFPAPNHKPTIQKKNVLKYVPSLKL